MMQLARGNDVSIRCSREVDKGVPGFTYIKKWKVSAVLETAQLRWSKVRILEMVRIVAHTKNSCRSELFCYLWWYAFAMSLYGKA